MVCIVDVTLTEAYVLFHTESGKHMEGVTVIQKRDSEKTERRIVGHAPNGRIVEHALIFAFELTHLPVLDEVHGSAGRV